MQRCGREEWSKFRRYHYLNGQLNTAAECYGCYDGGEIIAFIGVLHFPHAKNPRIKTIHRLCVLPDYQGIGIGTKFLEFIAANYAAKGFDVKITTSAKNLIAALNKSKMWRLTRYSVPKTKSKISGNTTRLNCKTATFFFQNTQYEII